MLVLARGIGETIYVGDAICITVYDKLRYHVMIGVLAPADIPLRVCGRRMRPAVLPDGERFYLLTLLNQEAFSIGDAHISVQFKPTFLGAGLRMRKVRVGVIAPPDVAVHREEIYRRIRHDMGQPLPAVVLSDWLHQANLAVSSHAAA